ncbi:glutathione transferase GstA [Silvanigrella paludirubra]|uniref:Glutathione transferase GstA n=1 Tax=Silvanigrella paludirubra TaxID=2499159 RepID=A0A6N6VSR2_9BACT|nr:glutathione binding-like protein [Silvanigrella paludirubra]KAB8037746.1 glutathione transferase GstA [Silvanigrella paludirubra]
MKLYFSKGSCSLASRIAINELGLDCQYEKVDFKTSLTESGMDFTKINAKGSVPVLQLSSGEILTEGSVILQYLADNHSQGGNFIPREMALPRYRVLEKLNFISSDFHKTVGIFFSPEISKEIKNSVLRPRLDKLTNYIEKELTQHSFFVGDHYTFADSYLFVILTWFDHIGVERKAWPKINAYFENLKNRPAIAKSLAEENNLN